MSRTAVVSGALANKPWNGGEAWVRLSWILGLRRLGFDVWFVEQIDPSRFGDLSERAFFDAVVSEFGLDGSAALLAGEGPVSRGVEWKQLLDVASEAEFLLNIGGHLTSPQLTKRIQKRIYLDIDPGYTQFWHASGATAARLDSHDEYFTIAENIDGADCQLPSNGIQWRKVRQPVLLDAWPVTPTDTPDRFTTIASWRHPFGRAEFAGATYGTKLDEFRKFIELPTKSPHSFELALAIDPEERRDLALLESNGWKVTSAADNSATPQAFRQYIQRSAAEFSVAQGIYVETNSGWFSDRSVKYLASGRPVLLQDTGFSRTLPVGEGLLTFTTPAQAAAEASEIVENYAHHSRMARKLAENFFSSDAVIGGMLE